MNGLLLINKASGPTSRFIVNDVVRTLKIDKVGHSGTLDPLASGLLVLGIGKGTKVFDLLTLDPKTYEATITLGIATDTLDATGLVTERQRAVIDEDLIKVSLSKMVGSYEQEVPAYSAKWVKGKRLYKYARHHQTVTLPKQAVTIYELKLIGKPTYTKETTSFKVRCVVSKGTYIRSLVRDIAHELATIGYLTSLVRTKMGLYDLKSAYTLADVHDGHYQLLSLKEALKGYKQVEAGVDLAKVKDGLPLPLVGEVVVYTNQGEAIAVYKSDGKVLKLWKRLA